jgi:methyltransferase FkbM-like protein
VTVYELALGGTDDEIPFTVGLDTVNKVAAVGVKNVRMIRQRRLDAVAGASAPVMMKMDVEGYEEEVIRGAQALLANDFLKVIELETVTPGISENLISNHFERAHYDPFSRKLEREQMGITSSNSVFVRDWVFVESRLATANHINVLGHTI